MALLQSCLASAANHPVLSVEASIALGAVAGRIDHLAYDERHQHLFVAELGNNSVGIVDLATRRLLLTLVGLDEPQGIAYEPFTDTLYVANGGDGSVRLYDGASFSPVGRIDLAADADNVRVDLALHRVYVGHGNGAIAVLDAVTQKKIGDITFQGHPESFQLDSTTPRIFVNVPGTNRIEVLSRDKLSDEVAWPTADFRGNFPLVVDEANQRLLVVFRRPARLQALDMKSGELLNGSESCGDADDLFVDSKRKWVHVICGDGSVDTYAMRGATFERISRFSTMPGSRTGLLLAELDRVVVAVRAIGKQPAAIWILRPSS